MRRSFTPLRLLAVAFAALVVAPEIATVVAQSPPAATPEALRARYFRDGGVDVSTQESPIDRTSAREYVFASAAGDVEILAVGVDRRGGGVEIPLDTSAAFHTTTDPLAMLGEGDFSVDGNGAARVAIVCRVEGPAGYGPCSDLAVTARVLAVPFTASDRVTLSAMRMNGDPAASYHVVEGSEPSYHPSPPEAASTLFAWPGEYASVGGHAEPSTPWRDATVRHDTDHSVFSLALRAEDTQVPAALRNRAGAHPSVVMVSAHLWSGNAQIGGLREPLWRVGWDSAAEALGPQWCELPAPARDAVRSYAFLPNSVYDVPTWSVYSSGAVPTWLASCEPIAGPVRLAWRDLLLAPGGASALARAAAQNDPRALAEAVGLAAISHLAFAPGEFTGWFRPNNPYPCVDRGTPVAFPHLACVDRAAARSVGAFRFVRIEVLDDDTWRTPTTPSLAFGGPTRITGVLEDVLDTSGRFHDLPLVVELTPAASSIAGVGARIGDMIVGSVGSRAPLDTLVPRPPLVSGLASVVPLVQPPGSDELHPFFASFATDAEAPGEPAALLPACVRDAFSHSQAGPVPNLPPGEPGAPPAFAIAGETVPTCIELRNLLNLTLGTLSLFAIAEIRAGATWGIDARLPGPQPRAVIAGLAAGELPSTTPAASLDAVAAAGVAAAIPRIGASRVVLTVPESLTAPQLADVALLLAWLLREDVASVAIEIDDLPLTPAAGAVLDRLQALQATSARPQIPILVPAGVLPPETWDLPLPQKLLTLSGLAAHPYVLTVGSGSIAQGVDPWSRLGPNPSLLPKPDFLAPSPVGTTSVALLNALPYVELLHLAGVFGEPLVRAGLAGLAIPHTATLQTFYAQGYGVLDPLHLVSVSAPSIEGVAAPIPALEADLVKAAAFASLARTETVEETVSIPVPSTMEIVGQIAPALQGTASVWTGEHLYVFGGGDSGAVAHDRIQRIDPATGERVLMAARLPSATPWASAVWTGTHAYVFSGWDGMSIYRYDPATDTVQTMSARFPSAWFRTSAAWTGSVVYIVGGSGSDNRLARYDPATDTLSVLPPTLPAGRGTGTVWSAGKLYIFGGWAGDFGSNPRDTIVSYTPTSGVATTLPTRLPSARGGVTVVWDGARAMITGGTSGGSEILFFDPATLSLETSADALPSARTLASSAWTGDAALVVGGKRSDGVFLDEVVRYDPEGVRYETVVVTREVLAPDGPIARTLADSTPDPEDVFGAILPPGTLDPFALLGTTVHARIDTPLVPLTLFTDWGGVNRETATPARLKLLDGDATLNASAHALRETLRDAILEPASWISGTSPITGDLADWALGAVDVSFAGEDHLVVDTKHYHLTDLLGADLLYALEAQVLGLAAESAGSSPQEAIDALVAATGATLPTAWTLTQGADRHVEADAAFSDDWPCAPHTLNRFVQRLRTFGLQQVDLVTGAALDAGLPPGDLLASESLGLAPVVKIPYAGALEDVLCDTSDPVWLLRYLQLARAYVENVTKLQKDLLFTAEWATQHPEGTVAAGDVVAALRVTAGLPPPGLTTATIDELDATLALLLSQIDLAIALAEELITRLAPTRNVATTQPRIELLTDPAATAGARLGPYVGLTTVTTRDVTVTNPLTGEPLLTRDVTVPIPSLLWNNPSLDVRLEYRDGTAASGTGVTLFDLAARAFARLDVNAEVEIDGVLVPLRPTLREADRLPGSAGPIQEARAWLDPAAESGLDAIEKHARQLARAALARLVLPLPGESELQDLVTGLYSKPLTLGNWTGPDGTARIPTAFPFSSAYRYHPYAYESSRTLAGIPGYTGGPAEGVAPLADADREIHRQVRDHVAARDEPADPASAPLWSHLPRPAEAAPVGGPAPAPFEIRDVDAGAVGAHHAFELDLDAGLDPIVLACKLFADHGRRFAAGHVAPFGCGGDTALLSLGEGGAAARVCEAVTPPLQPACREALAIDDRDARLAACVESLLDGADCAALLRAAEILEELSRAVAPSPGDVAQIPFVKSLTRILLDRAAELGLTEDEVYAAARALPANAPFSDDAVRAAVASALASHGSLLSTAVGFAQPGDETETFTIGQALHAHGADRVSGVEWSFAVAPHEDASLQATLDLLDAALPRLRDADDAAFAATTRDALAAMTSPDLRGPTPAEARARATPWFPGAGVEGVDLGGQPAPHERLLLGADLAASLARTRVLPAQPLPDVPVRIQPEDASATWTRTVRAASILHDARAENLEPLETGRRLATLLGDASAWQVDAGRDEIRASSTSLTPKVGVFTYSVDLPPHDLLHLRTDGEYYFENTDAFLFLTSSSATRDTILAARADLAALLSTVPDPTARAPTLLAAVQDLTDGSTHLASRHLNPAVRIEHWEKRLTSPPEREDRFLVRYGGLRVRSAADAFELPGGTDELHLVVLFFPIVDSATVDAARAWLATTDPAAAATYAQDGLATKFVLGDFALSWDTHLGLETTRAGDSAGATVSFASPYRNRVEDVSLSWAVPATARDAGTLALDVLAAGQPALAAHDLRYVSTDPRGARGSWAMACNDNYAAGRYYTPSLSGPRGVALHGAGNYVLGEDGVCDRNILSAIHPSKWPGGGRTATYGLAPKPPLSALQYDVNLVLQVNDQAWTRLPFETHAEAGGLVQVDECVSWLYPALDPLRLLSYTRGPCAEPRDLLPADTVLGPVLGPAEALMSHAARSTLDAAAPALGVLHELAGLGAVEDLEPEVSYRPRATFAGGAGGLLSQWAIVDRAQLRAMALAHGEGHELSFVEAIPYEQRSSPFALQPAPAPARDEPPTSAAADAEPAHRDDLDANGVEDVLDERVARSDPASPLDVLLTFPDADAAESAVAAIVALADLPALAALLPLDPDETSKLGALPRSARAFTPIPVVAATLPAGLVHALPTATGALRAFHDAVVTSTLHESHAAIGSDAAVASFGVTGAGVTIGIVDTGIDATHATLDDFDDDPGTADPKVVAWVDLVHGRSTPYDDNGHGTHVAGIAAGTGAGAGHVGVAPGANLAGIKVLGASGSGSESAVVAGIQWAILSRETDRPIDVLSLSLGSPRRTGGKAPQDVAVDTAVDEGIVVVVAAGNDGPGRGTVGSPAEAAEALTVGAVNHAGHLAGFSSRGPTLDGRVKPDVVAPGVGVVAARAGAPDGFVAKSGTSMATPHVSGVVALVLEAAAGSLDARDARDLVVDTADGRSADPTFKADDVGAGRVNAFRAVDAVEPRVHDVAVQALVPPARLAPGESAPVLVAIRNQGLAEASGVRVDLALLQPDGTWAPIASEPLPSMPGRTRRTLEIPWTPPTQEGISHLRARVEPTPEEAAEADADRAERAAELGVDPAKLGRPALDNNERLATAWVTTLAEGTTHPWLNLTQAFDPGRLVLGLVHDVVYQANDDSVSALLRSGGILLDGVSGRALAGEVRGKALVAFEPEEAGENPLTDQEIDVFARIGWKQGSAAGGTSRVLVHEGRPLHETPPGACWTFPTARWTLQHGVCWLGNVHAVAGAEAAASPRPAQCRQAVESALEGAAPTATNAALAGTALARHHAGGPLGAGPAPDGAQATGDAARLGVALASAVGANAIGAALACAASLGIAPPSVLAFAYPPNLGSVPLVTDLASSLPVQVDPAVLALVAPGALAPPADVEAAPGDGLGTALVSWSPAASSTPTRLLYRVHRAGPDGAWAYAGETPGRTFADDGLADDTPYQYRVTTVTALGEGDPSQPASMRTYARLEPPAPAALAGQPGPGAREVALSWIIERAASVPPPSGFRVSRADPDGGAWEYDVADRGAAGADGRIAFTHDGRPPAGAPPLTEGANYTFGIRATNDVGAGPQATIVVRTWNASVPSPVGPIDVEDVGGALRLSWAPASETWAMPPHAFHVERDQGEGFRYLRTTYSPALVDASFATGGPLAYRVRALNDAGYAGATAIAVGLPEAPTLSFERAPGALVLSWPPADERQIRGYHVQVERIGSGEPPTQATIEGGGATSFRYTGVQPDSRYRFAVSAYNSLGTGAPALLEVEVRQPAAPPTGFKAEPGALGGEIALAWGPPAHTGGWPLEGYLLERSAGSADYAPVATLPAEAVSFVDTALPSARHDYRLHAVTAEGFGEPALAGSRPRVEFLPRDAPAFASDGTTVYILGGLKPDGPTREIARYDPSMSVPQVLADVELPAPTYGGSAFVHEGVLYLLGGRLAKTYPGGIVAWDSTSTIVAVDLETGTAQTLTTKLPKATSEAAIAWTGEHAYLMGGRRAVATTDFPNDEIVRFDPETESAVVTGRLPAPLVEAMGVYAFGEVYVLGGRSYADSKWSYEDDVQRLASGGAVAIRVGTLPEPRALGSALFDGHSVLVFGGRTALLWGTRDVLKMTLDPATGTETIVRMSQPLARDHRNGAAAWLGSAAQLFEKCCTAPDTWRPTPSAPTGLTTAPVAPSGEILLNWTAPGTGTYSHLRSFRIYRAAGAGAEALVGETPSTRWDDAGLQRGASYTYRVSAVDVHGNEGPHSGTATAQAAAPPVGVGRPGPPRNVAASPLIHGVRLTWTAPERDGGAAVGSYEIHQIAADGSTTRVATSTTLSKDVTGLAAGTRHEFEVRAVTHVGAGPPSLRASAIPYGDGVPPPPSLLSALTGTRGSEIALSWSAVTTPSDVEPVKSYAIYRGTTPSNLVQVATTTGTSHVDVVGAANATRWYAVHAVNGAGSSGPSPLAHATTLRLPGAPTMVNATTPLVRGAVDLTWKAPADDGGNPLTGYTINRKHPYYGFSNRTVPASPLSWRDAGLADDNITLMYRVAATTTAGLGPWSDWAYGQTASLPGPITYTTVIAHARGEVNASWYPPTWNGTAPVTGYRVRVGPSGTTPADWGINTTRTLRDVVGQDNVTRWYWIRPVSAIGEGQETILSGRTWGVPYPPRQVAWEPAAEGKTRVFWQPPSNDGGTPITLYRVYRTIGALTELAGETTTTSFLDQPLVPASYTYKVRAVNAVGEGNPG